MIKAIIFDADGTLYKVKTEKAYKKMFLWLDNKTGINSEKLEKKFKEIVNEILNSDPKNPAKRKRKYSLKKTLTHFNIKSELTEEALQIFWNQIIKDLEFSEETKQIIEKLNKKYILVIASEEFKENLELKLNKIFSDYKKYFSLLVTPELTNEMKPSEKFYQIALERLNLKPEEFLVIGDNWQKDLELAKNLGMKTILINKEKEGKEMKLKYF